MMVNTGAMAHISPVENTQKRSHVVDLIRGVVLSVSRATMSISAQYQSVVSLAMVLTCVGYGRVILTPEHPLPMTTSKTK